MARTDSDTDWTLDARFTSYWTDKSGNVFVLARDGFISLGVKNVEFITWSKSRRIRALKELLGNKHG